jgi:hypothetical protein
MCPASALDKYYVIRFINCYFKRCKKLKNTGGPAGTPLGILCYKWGTLFSLFPGSERCKFENYSFRNPRKPSLSNLPHKTGEKLQQSMGSFEDPSLVRKS